MTEQNGSGTAMEPSRDPRVTLPDLVEVLLNKGVYLNLDLIITVSDIPLIGINLRATLAGIETMLEYGMMRSWDERTRAWVRRAVSRDVPLRDDEEIVAKMAGGHYQDDFYAAWRPGAVYLTNRRLLVFRRDPKEMLWESPLEAIEGVELRSERTIGGENRVRLHVTTVDGGRAVLSAASPERLHELMRTQGMARVGTGTVMAPMEQQDLVEGRMWYHEQRSGGAVWRGGTGRLEEDTGLSWKGSLDVRPAVRIRPAQILEAELVPGQSPVGDGNLLSVTATDASVHLAVDDATSWLRALDSLRLRSSEPGGAPGPVRSADTTTKGYP